MLELLLLLHKLEAQKRRMELYGSLMAAATPVWSILLAQSLYLTATHTLSKLRGKGEEKKEENIMREILEQALMLPIPIKDIKMEGNKIIVEVEESEGGEEAKTSS